MQTLIKFFILWVLLGTIGCSTCGKTEIKNFHQVNPEIYRSSQPDKQQMQTIVEIYGIKSVINLREYHSDVDETANLSVKLYEVPLAAGDLSEEDLRKVLQIMQKAPKPLLVHCMHGSDRTGAVIAAYRIACENYPVEKAIDELKNERFGHHKYTYPNIEHLLRSIKWHDFRNALQ